MNGGGGGGGRRRRRLVAAAAGPSSSCNSSSCCSWSRGSSSRAALLGLWVLLAAAASSAAALAKETAFVEVVLFESSPGGDYTTYTTGLQGRFSRAGATLSAEGEIVQMHPLGLCNSNDEEDLYEYGWVGVVKLEQPELEPKPCLTVLGKANRARKNWALSSAG
ncbi:E3 ubiquitin-protein ligase ZNRF3-like [Sphaerodactylus townsendi]|uniref:E3 ubiquitin-protein ligase ZNRF3-like n=1 Tax=Sphaerodactylus townsendi TaxID=933632 RepID=UPI002026EBD7|nr:E3 ubiquitin-protein ligase ZNRF3-like [Sphaerodactylus townsendi]